MSVIALVLGLCGPVHAASSHAASSHADSSLVISEAELEPLTFAHLPGWRQDDHRRALSTFRRSCQALARQRPRPEGLGRALRNACRKLPAASSRSAAQARRFFEVNFRPLRISRLGERQGFLTGYYEPVVEGSRTPVGDYTVPMHARPPDLEVPGRREGVPLPNNGQVFRRAGTDLVPYYTRAEIEDGALAGKALELCYLKDPIDAFFIHIQGSARVRLADGKVLRLNYDSHNGYPYTPVGRLLIERNLVPREEMSMERIRRFMQDHPAEGRALRRENRSYVFFRLTRLSARDEALGAQGVPLTSGRSIAVDKTLHIYGTPFWIDADLPLKSDTDRVPYRRLHIAQDTGSAIVGPARADLYFGAGREAGLVAGRIRHPGRFVMLVPRAVDPAAAARRMPLPRPKPNVETRGGTREAGEAPLSAVSKPVLRPAREGAP